MGSLRDEYGVTVVTIYRVECVACGAAIAEGPREDDATSLAIRHAGEHEMRATKRDIAPGG
jgi:hypothetical protein